MLLRGNKNQREATSFFFSYFLLLLFLLLSFFFSSAAAAAAAAREARVVAVVVVVLNAGVSSAEPKGVPEGNSREEAPGVARLLVIYISIISNIQTKLGGGFTYLD